LHRPASAYGVAIRKKRRTQRHGADEIFVDVAEILFGSCAVDAIAVTASGGDLSCNAVCTMSGGTPACAARLPISRHAIAGKPGMTGSTRNPDSCSITATIAQTFSCVGSMPSDVNAACISAAQPDRSDTVRGNDRSIIPPA